MPEKTRRENKQEQAEKQEKAEKQERQEKHRSRIESSKKVGPKENPF